VSWLFAFILVIIVLVILRKVVGALSRLVINLLFILIGLAFLLAILPPEILGKLYNALPKGVVEVIRGPIAALRGKLPLPY